MEIKMSSKLLDIDKSTDDKYSLFIYLMSYYLCTITQMVYKQQLTSNYSLLKDKIHNMMLTRYKK